MVATPHVLDRVASVGLPSLSRAEAFQMSERWKMWLPFVRLSVSRTCFQLLSGKTRPLPNDLAKALMVESLRQHHADILCRLLRSRISLRVIKRNKLDDPLRDKDEFEDLIREFIARD